MNDARFVPVNHFRIDNADLDNFVNETLGFEARGDYNEYPFCFESYEEAAPNASYDYHVDGYVDEWSVGELEKWLIDPWNNIISVQTVLDYLCAEGHLDAGSYLVEML